MSIFRSVFWCVCFSRFTIQNQQDGNVSKIEPIKTHGLDFLNTSRKNQINSTGYEDHDIEHLRFQNWEEFYNLVQNKGDSKFRVLKRTNVDRSKRATENVKTRSTYQVTLLIKKNGVSGDIRIPIITDGDSRAGFVYFVLAGENLRKCLLRSPTGNILNILSEDDGVNSKINKEPTNFTKKNFILNLPTNEDRNNTGSWTLVASGENYNVTAFEIRKIFGNSTNRISTAQERTSLIDRKDEFNLLYHTDPNYITENTEWHPMIVKREDTNIFQEPLFSNIPMARLVNGYLNLQQVPVTIDVNSRSILYAVTGEVVSITFDIRNYGPDILILYFYCYYQQIPCEVQPKWVRLFPIRTISVIVTVRADGAEGSAGVVSLQSRGYITLTKKAYLYIGRQKQDTTKPDIYYTFNGDCENADKGDTCQSKQWSVDIKAQDYESGLLKVWSEPPALLFTSEFIAGTKDPVNARYTATCCNPKVDITAMDLKGNTYQRMLDVQHQYLSFVEVTAIILGILLLIIIITISIYCGLRWRRKRQERTFLSGN